MLQKTLLTGVVMTGWIFSGAAMANDMKMFHRTGAWASLAGINDEGNSQCTTATGGSIDNSQAAVMLKFSASNPTELIIHLVKLSWKIPSGTTTRVQFQVDNAPGRVYNARGSDDGLGFLLNFKDTDSVTGESSIVLLFNLLMSGQTLNISFPDGNERPWRASLNGSATELGQFGNCIQTIKTADANKKTPTQPFNPGKSTQPFQETSREPAVPQEKDEAVRKVVQPFLNM